MKKGFTLIELLAVITLLALIMLVITPTLINNLTETRKELNDSQKKLIYSATDKYVKENKNLYPNVANAEYCVTLNELADEGLLSDGIMNFIDESNVDMNYGVKVTVESKLTYAYKFDYEENLCDSIKTTELVYNYKYNGTFQTFKAPKDGTYRIELWGASGGNAGSINSGLGAYTKGDIKLKKDEKLYLYLGEQGTSTIYGSFGGGGSGGNGGSQLGNSGGGATDVRLISGSFYNPKSLNSRIMVAAGGGGIGVGSYSEAGGKGFAGALTGFNGSYYSGHGDIKQYGKGGTQISGGLAGVNTYGASGTNEDGSFGIGGNAKSTSDMVGAGGGGGGYYGGGAGGAVSSGGSGNGGAGGSSYISGHAGCIAIKSENDSTPKVTTYSKIEDSYHYSGKKFTNTLMVAGNASMPSPLTESNMVGNNGNGYARITFIS